MEEDLKEKNISEEPAPASPADVGGAKAAKAPLDPKKKRVRILVSVIAALIVATFIGLSVEYFTTMVTSIVFVVAVIVVSLAFVAIFRDWETVYKLSITVLYIAAVCLIVYFSLSKVGLFDSINSAEDVKDYINNSGGVAEVIFVLANFLQVTIIPIPSTITTTAGALLFEGIWKPLYLTVIGLVVGSMFAFFLGRVFGVRFANWLVGEKTINKYHEFIKGRDKVVLFYMFLFPFFPDDFLCILAGMTNYTYVGFFLLQGFSRTIGTLTTILLTKGIVSIPLEGWWLALWAVIIIAVVILLIMTIKYSDKLERGAMKVIDKLTFGLTEKLRKKKAAALQSGTLSVAGEEATSDVQNVEEQPIETAADQGGDPDDPV